MAVSKEALIKLLETTLEAVKNDDSMEGRIQYEFGDKPSTYNVDFFVRLGNSQGQGSAIFHHDRMRESGS